MAEPRDRSQRLYDDLSWIWPMWGDPATEYRGWSEELLGHIRRYASGELATLLNLACGGGKNVYTLRRYFEVTGLDLSETMLDHARTLNPGCEFVRWDMRDFELDRRFDVVLIDDGITYITTEAELLQTFRNAFRHLRSGGVLVTAPDHIAETYEQNSTQLHRLEPHLEPEHLDVIIVENNYDPDPGDTTAETTFVYLIREHGELRIEHDLHIVGLFSIELWRDCLRRAGFELHEEHSSQLPKGVPVLIGVKP
jgi:SAM-dependent methyltransferase